MVLLIGLTKERNAPRYLHLNSELREQQAGDPLHILLINSLHCGFLSQSLLGLRPQPMQGPLINICRTLKPCLS